MPKRSASEYLAELHEIARSRGGCLLSARYVDDTTKLRFRCGAGHAWDASPGKIKQGRWCPTCGSTRSPTVKKLRALERLERIVRRRNGMILTPEYVSSQTKMCYRCAERHEWAAVPNSILQGKWCPRCANARKQDRRRLAVFRRLRRVIQKQGGEVLESGFAGWKIGLLVRCARGHELRRLPSSLDENVPCPQCKEDDWLAEMCRRAEAHGGACLSKRCRDRAARVRLVCARGHRFVSPAARVKRGKWCPRCRLATPHGLAKMREIARERGGACLSRSYTNASKAMRWRCAEGHEWRAPARSIVRGTWCGVCSRGYGKSRRRLSIEIMRQMAVEHGGACLSKEYLTGYDRLRWRCARGHEWVTRAEYVRRGHWCPMCSHAVPGTLERMRALAAERGGRCLTAKRNDHKQPLHFECGKGHRFRLRSNVVKSGAWCPLCPRETAPAQRGRFAPPESPAPNVFVSCEDVWGGSSSASAALSASGSAERSKCGPISVAARRAALRLLDCKSSRHAKILIRKSRGEGQLARSRRLRQALSSQPEAFGRAVRRALGLRPERGPR